MKAAHSASTLLYGEASLQNWATHFARQLRPPCTVWLQGPLGAGKTTLARAVLRALGFSGPVRSPTYTLVETYPLALGRFCHFDLYRTADPEELEYIGIREYFDQQSLVFIEWPELGEACLPPPDLIIQLEMAEGGAARRLTESRPGAKP